MSNNIMTYEFAKSGENWTTSDIDKGISAVHPWDLFLDIWHKYLQGGAEPPFSGRNNLKIFALLSAGVESVQSGRPVQVADNPRYTAAFKGEEE